MKQIRDIYKKRFKICQMCSTDFYGGGGAKYCLECKDKAIIATRKRQEIKKAKKEVTKVQLEKDMKLIMKGL